MKPIYYIYFYIFYMSLYLLCFCCLLTQMFLLVFVFRYYLV